MALTLLIAKIATTPILKHFDLDRPPVVVLYASKWAISAALIQMYDGVYWPVTFTSRTLKVNEINYGIVKEEVLALLRILNVCYNTLVSRKIAVCSVSSTFNPGMADAISRAEQKIRQMGSLVIELDNRDQEVRDG